MKNSPRAYLTDIAYSYVLPNALSAIAKLNVAESLVNGAQTAEQIAQQLHLHAPSLKRVLMLLVKYDIFGFDNEERFSLTPLSELFISSSHSIRDNIIFVHDLFSKSLNDLEYTIQT